MLFVYNRKISLSSKNVKNHVDKRKCRAIMGLQTKKRERKTNKKGEEVRSVEKVKIFPYESPLGKKTTE